LSIRPDGLGRLAGEAGMSQVRGLAAVILITRDFEAQAAFYRDVLQLPVAGDYGDALFLRCGSQTLGLFDRSHHPEGTKRLDGAAKGISHLEFAIAAEDRAALVARLTAAGCHVRSENFEDADGNLFHFTITDD
jgi:catechol 2,3-dioxygenase-like lactoylglutathione lyase family enzyme